METLYRKVKCSDRLPKTEGWYFVAVACNDFDNLDIYHWDKGSSESWINTFEWWLEELPPQEQVGVESFKMPLPKGFRIDYMPDPNMPKSRAVLMIHPDNIPQPPKAKK